jgi:hypothetical protein
LLTSTAIEENAPDRLIQKACGEKRWRRSHYKGENYFSRSIWNEDWVGYHFPERFRHSEPDYPEKEKSRGNSGSFFLLAFYRLPDFF